MPLHDFWVNYKYHNKYKDVLHWKTIQPGNTSEPAKVKVRYNTGLTTKGISWWKVFWYNEERTTMFISNPNNYRNVVDFLGKPVVFGLSAAAITTFVALNPELVAFGFLEGLTDAAGALVFGEAASSVTASTLLADII
ncbi:hypothetical protein QQS21_012277 [Conoideocrella luteorostrata]|uniref:Up-regulated in Daf-2 domain-containing protein n=1 Tax=Conoideocrella luteorostrata TaxID=1105319 RepID=A0AAJ0CBI1_9HYPO|nr:hypothetical protein QQS21_012277 [Conoideocrella luteorostrata]